MVLNEEQCEVVTETQAPDALLRHGDLEAIAETLVLCLVHLQARRIRRMGRRERRRRSEKRREGGAIAHLEPALDEVERRDGGVGDAAAQHAAERTQGEVLLGAELAAKNRC